MKPLAKYAQHGSALAGALVRDPAQLRQIPRWARSMGRTTMSAELPWLPFAVIDRLERELSPASSVFEFGGGGSTLWFARRVHRVVTVEHDPHWFPQLEAAVGTRRECTLIRGHAEDDYADYVGAIDAFPDASFDAVVVDGRERVRCFERALPKVKPGGLLVLDDTMRARYRPAFDLAAGWPCTTYDGLTPTKNLPGVTTIWQRPAS